MDRASCLPLLCTDIAVCDTIWSGWGETWMRWGSVSSLGIRSWHACSHVFRLMSFYRDTSFILQNLHFFASQKPEAGIYAQLREFTILRASQHSYFKTSFVLLWIIPVMQYLLYLKKTPYNLMKYFYKRLSHSYRTPTCHSRPSGQNVTFFNQ